MVRFNLDAHKALLVIAHPDDECMFFAPTLSVLTAQHVQVFVLCLSNGGCGEIGSWLFFLARAARVPFARALQTTARRRRKHAGNADGLGAVREKELLAACTVLRVRLLRAAAAAAVVAAQACPPCPTAQHPSSTPNRSRTAA